MTNAVIIGGLSGALAFSLMAAIGSLLWRCPRCKALDQVAAARPQVPQVAPRVDLTPYPLWTDDPTPVRHTSLTPDAFPSNRTVVDVGTPDVTGEHDEEITWKHHRKP